MLGFLLWFSLSLGIQDQILYTSFPYQHAPIFAEIGLHAENEWLDIYAVYRNEMEKIHSIYFRPRLDFYTVGARMSYRNISLTVEHQCTHPVGNYGMKIDNIHGSYNRVFLTITSKGD